MGGEHGPILLYGFVTDIVFIEVLHMNLEDQYICLLLYKKGILQKY
jgi:hypothetical protein